jgi:hypothetical protein
MAGLLTVVLRAARAMSRQRGWAQHPLSWVLVVLVWGTQLHGWSPRWRVTPCSRYVTAAWLGPAPSSWVLVVLVWGTQLHGWSPYCYVTPCSRYVTAACWGPALPFMGAGGSSVGNAAAWLVPLLACYALLVPCHGSVVGPSTPFLGAGGSSGRTQLHDGSLAGVLLSRPS